MGNIKPKKALDLAGNAATVAALAVDVGATGGAISAGKLLWEAVTAGVSRRRRREAEAFLTRLADALGTEAASSLAAELDPNGENRVWDVVEEGYRAMMAAIHETAKRAISKLVADYVVRQSQPDRDYQLTGGLLAATDENLLRATLTVTKEFVEVYDRMPTELNPPAQQSEILEESYTLVKGPGTASTEEVWVLRVTRTAGHNRRLASAGSPPPAPTNLGIVLRLLDRFELCSLPNGGFAGENTSTYSDERHHNGGEAQLYVLQGAEVRLRRLHDYLSYALALA